MIMKQLLYSVLLIGLFALSCSSPEPQQEASNTTEMTASTSTETSPDAMPTESSEAPMTDESAPAATEGMPTESSEGTPVAPTTASTAAPSDKAPASMEEKTMAPPATTQQPTTTSKTTPTSSPAPTTTSKTPSKSSPAPATKPARPTLSHDSFDQLLRKYVSSSGWVNYDGFKMNKAKLSQYLEILKNNPPQKSWSKNKEMAYWINMYNAITILAVAEKYPVSSIMDLEGGKIWDKKMIVIGGKSLTLNNIEKDMLLKRFKEPRVHFAVNCGAKSCPPLLNKAWTEDNVQRYYEKQAKAFINNKTENTVSAKSLEISQIFNWYTGDFGGSDKIIPYFQKYSDVSIKNNAKVKFKEYNWKLNKQ